MVKTATKQASTPELQVAGAAEPKQLPAVVASNATSLLQAITTAASNPQVDIEKMERLFAMHQQMVKQEAEAAFNAAMARVQAQLTPIVRNAYNEHTHSGYAKLDAIHNAILPVYPPEGISVSFDTADCPTPGMIRTIALVSHSAGHTRQHHLDLPPDDAGSQGKVNKTKVQATGSSNEYARRYLHLMIFNLSTFDDKDGNKNAVEQDDEPQQPATYPDDKFTANLPAWTELMKSGKKTAEKIIATVSSKAALTEEQKAAIRKAGQQTDQEFVEDMKREEQRQHKPREPGEEG